MLARCPVHDLYTDERSWARKLFAVRDGAPAELVHPRLNGLLGQQHLLDVRVVLCYRAKAMPPRAAGRPGCQAK
jgi:hypothetical protein